jgi:RHS repeat-associated protein
VDTGLSYMNARYYNGTVGRFISQDPVFISVGAEHFNDWLSDPQSQNSYSYARNNPLIAVDLDGNYARYIPGTFNNNANYLTNNSNGRALLQAVSQTFSALGAGQTQIFNWNGGGTDIARWNAGLQLAHDINVNAKSDEPVALAGHSHGGNIAFIASTMTKHEINYLASLATPIIDEYQPNIDNVGVHVNAYSRRDGIQVNGGIDNTVANSLGNLLSKYYGVLGNNMANELVPSTLEHGSAGRTLNNGFTYNVNVTKYTSALNPFQAHTDVQTAGVWVSEITKLFSSKK